MAILSKIYDFTRKAYNKIIAADWSNPKNPLLLISCVILPFVAWYYVSTAFVIGLLMSISILWLLEKSPNFIKYLVAKFPFASDLILSTLVVALFGGYFGSGLTLGLGAVFTAIVLSWGLQAFAERYKEEKKRSYETAHAT